jgi:glucosamine--fructose-6-phosphate aminotransferase (isomerizing)
MTRAGPEIGVASTKAFLTQLTALALVALELGRHRGVDPKRYSDGVAQLEHLPAALREVLALDPALAELAERFAHEEHALVPRPRRAVPDRDGRRAQAQGNLLHPRRGLPRRRAQARPARARSTSTCPVIAVAPNDRLLEKLKSNVEEVRARGGELYVLADADGRRRPWREQDHLITVPAAGEMIQPMLYHRAAALLAYHVAVLRGTDVDQPRNLAKSVRSNNLLGGSAHCRHAFIGLASSSIVVERDTEVPAFPYHSRSG